MGKATLSKTPRELFAYRPYPLVGISSGSKLSRSYVPPYRTYKYDKYVNFHANPTNERNVGAGGGVGEYIL